MAHALLMTSPADDAIVVVPSQGGSVSEERFIRIEGRLDAVAADVAVLKTDVAVLKTDVAVLKTDVAGLKTDVAGLKTDVTDLRRHMGVLHEDVIGRIRALGEDDSLRREMQAGFTELRELLTSHAAVGNAADRQFASTLDDHERRISRLEDR